jgi:hypothetical protein
MNAKSFIWGQDRPLKLFNFYLLNVSRELQREAKIISDILSQFQIYNPISYNVCDIKTRVNTDDIRGLSKLGTYHFTCLLINLNTDCNWPFVHLAWVTFFNITSRRMWLNQGRTGFMKTEWTHLWNGYVQSSNRLLIANLYLHKKVQCRSNYNAFLVLTPTFQP